MTAKFFALVLLVAAAQANVENYSAFSYGVKDPHTGDVKDQHEKRVGDSVVGQYSLLESDGTKRIVDYAAHPHTGFNAVVRKVPSLSVHPVTHGGYAAPAIAHAPIAHAAPATYGYSTTVALGAYAAPYAAYGRHGAYAGYGGLTGYAGYGGHAGYGGYGGHAGHAGYGGHGIYGAYASPLAAGYGGYGYGAGLGW